MSIDALILDAHNRYAAAAMRAVGSGLPQDAREALEIDAEIQALELLLRVSNPSLSDKGAA